MKIFFSDLKFSFKSYLIGVFTAIGVLSIIIPLTKFAFAQFDSRDNRFLSDYVTLEGDKIFRLSDPDFGVVCYILESSNLRQLPNISCVKN